MPVLCELGLAVEGADGMELVGCRITNAVACVPPQNAPIAAEVRNCAPKLAKAMTPATNCIVTLGGTAHRAVMRVLGAAQRDLPFAHAVEGEIAGKHLIASYHPSQYNVNTGRITRGMLSDVLGRASARCQ